VPAPQTPSVLSVEPNSGIGNPYTFSFRFNDGNGATDISRTQVRFTRGGATTQANACVVAFNRLTNELSLLNDAGTSSSAAVTIRSANRVQNSQCVVDAAGSRVTLSGTQMLLDLSLIFTPAFEGTDPKDIGAEATDLTSRSSGFVSLGHWVAAQSIPSNPQITMSPNGGAGAAQLFRFHITNPNGAADTVRAQIVLNRTMVNAPACLVYYDRGTNSVSLMNDAYTSYANSIPLGAAGTLQNSQCTVNPALSSTLISGNSIILDLSVSFRAPFAGAKSVFAELLNSAGVSTGYGTIGSWVVPY